MLNGFEHTKPLTDKELKELVPVFVAGLKRRIGKSNAITASKICATLKETKGLEITDVTVRKIINHIRKNKLVRGIVAHGKGYHVTNDPHEVKEYLKSLRGRKNELIELEKEMIDYLKELEYKKQGTLI